MLHHWLKSHLSLLELVRKLPPGILLLAKMKALFLRSKVVAMNRYLFRIVLASVKFCPASRDPYTIGKYGVPEAGKTNEKTRKVMTPIRECMEPGAVNATVAILRKRGM